MTAKDKIAKFCLACKFNRIYNTIRTRKNAARKETNFINKMGEVPSFRMRIDSKRGRMVVL